jgi:hypothetical protein
MNDWILANVIGSIEDGYEIEDVEDDGYLLNTEERPGTRKRYQISQDLMLAILNNPQKIFEQRERVLALYPSSTCFYRGVVLQSPKDVVYLIQTRNYVIQFEDDGGFERFVDMKMVLELPGEHQS